MHWKVKVVTLDLCGGDFPEVIKDFTIGDDGILYFLDYVNNSVIRASLNGFKLKYAGGK